MATALDIVTDALLRIGVYAAGETISDADAERCLSILNDMLDSWSNESLSCYAILEQSGTLQVGVSSYTIGSGGVFNMTRPLKLIDGPGAAYLQDGNGNDYPVSVVPRDKWNLIGSRGANVTSNIPDTLFYDPQFPLGIINLFPTPNIAFTLFWDSYLQLTDFTSLSSAVSLPPGYKAALQSSLALEIWPDFKPDGSMPSPLLVEIASKHKGNVKRTNIRPVEANYDPELVSRATATYNVYVDRSGGLS